MLVVAMFVPVVLGGGLLVVSLTGVGVQGRPVGAARADVGPARVVPPVRVSAAGPDVVYGRIVEKAVRRASVKRGQDAEGPRQVAAGPSRDARGRRDGVGKARPSGGRRVLLEAEARERPGRRGDGESAKRLDEEKGREGADCPPEEGERRTERVEEADREYSVLPGLGVRILTTKGE